MESFQELYQKNPRIPAQAQDFFRLIPQKGVRHAIVEQEPTHNAIWDMNVRKSDGRVFLSVCGEGLLPNYARLYEYIPGEARFVHHFSLEKESIQQDRAIRASKFHTCIQFLDDGRLIMQTHTTSPSPLHPTWLAEGYANHQWEAFQGSEIFYYHPDTRLVENKGTLSPYVSLYGGGLSNRGKLFFGTGIFDGVGYLYDLDTNESTCLGQVTDGRSNRFYEGPDGHIYYGTYTGHLARLNVDTRKIEILAQLSERSPMRHGVFDQDGVFWFSTRIGKILYTYDTRNGICKEAGRFLEADYLAPGSIYCYGFDFDSSGCLWFCSNVIFTVKGNVFDNPAGSRLYKWDVLRGKEPVDFGFIGTAGKRSVALCAQASIHNDILYVTDGNHLGDAVGIVEIDLSRLSEEEVNSTRPLSTDPLNYFGVEQSRQHFPLGEAEYDRLVQRDMDFSEDAHRDKGIQFRNSSYAAFRKSTGIALWEHLGYGNGSVKALQWEDNETLRGVCGNDVLYSFRLRLEESGLRMLEHQKDPKAVIPSQITVPVPDGVILPCVPGRQYLAEAECSVGLADGSILVGTKDMMLCRISGSHVQGLGAVATSGGVHSLCAAPDGETVYGVSGYETGRGNLFRYSVSDGLFWLGMVPFVSTASGRQLVSNRPWVCSVSPDGKHLAIGALDEMSGVCVFSL